MLTVNLRINLNWCAAWVCRANYIYMHIFFFHMLFNYCFLKMRTCDFTSFSKVECKESYRKFEGHFNLTDCNLNVTEYFKSLLNKNSKIEILEYDLIMMRSGLRPNIQKYQHFDICAGHRCLLGLQFESKLTCEHPNHKNQSVRNAIYLKVNYDSAKKILENRYNGNGHRVPFIPIGASLCYDCHKIIHDNLDDNITFEHVNQFSILKDMCDESSSYLFNTTFILNL